MPSAAASSDRAPAGYRRGLDHLLGVVGVFVIHVLVRAETVASEQCLCAVGDTVHYRGKPVHVASWARKFLFDPAKFSTSVGDLSGGEQARILLANRMLDPADVHSVAHEAGAGRDALAALEGAPLHHHLGQRDRS